MKLLGVYITPDLKWATHTKHITKAASRKLFMFTILRQFCTDLSDLRPIYIYKLHSSDSGILFSTLAPRPNSPTRAGYRACTEKSVQNYDRVRWLYRLRLRLPSSQPRNSQGTPRRRIQQAGERHSFWFSPSFVPDRTTCVPSVAERSKALESDAGAGGESPVRAPVRAATLCPYARLVACVFVAGTAQRPESVSGRRWPCPVYRAR